MTWFAIRTEPGAQKPQREYTVETTALDAEGRPRGKGYRIVPSLNANVSAVERALSDAGFVHWMPSERRLIRDRRHTDVYRGRRFAMLVGYVFVLDPHDWRLLEEVPGVAHVVRGLDHQPLSIDIRDILTVRSMEALAEERFDREARRAQKIIQGKAKRNPTLRRLLEKLDAASLVTVPVHEALAA